MLNLDPRPTPLPVIDREFHVDEAHVAAAAFLARYSGRTLDAYRHDLRTFFQWAEHADLAVLKATRPHIELYRTALEERGLAPSTIDRRLSTVCGFYRFAHIDGRVSANPAQYVRRPKVQPSQGRGLDRREFGTFIYTAERWPEATILSSCWRILSSFTGPLLFAVKLIP
jgi:site-specific recombinase XerD